MTRVRLRRWGVPALPAGALLLMFGAIWGHEISLHHEGVEWYLGRADGATLTVAMRGGDCDRLEHVEVDETPEQVTVGVIYEFPARPGDFACTQQLTVRCATVELASPIGSRRLVHAATGERPATVDAYYPGVGLPWDVRSLYETNC
jgi:hypothetical protein